MRCVDVNVLVNAHRPEAPDHDRYRAWLDDARTSDEALGVSDLVLSGFLRVVTHPRIFREPTPHTEALAAVDAVRHGANVVLVSPGDRHWQIFRDLVASAEARGNLVPDAYLAAMAIERGATWYSADRGFARFPRLDWRHPLD